MKKLFATIVLMLLFVVASQCIAAPLFLGIKTYTQPNGDTIKVENIQDEFGEYFIASKGMAVQDNAGYWCYGAYDSGHNLLPTRYRVGSEAENEAILDSIAYTNKTKNQAWASSIRGTSSSHSIGSAKTAVVGQRQLLVVLVDFLDAKGTYNQRSYYENLLFSNNTYTSSPAPNSYVTVGSMRDYYWDMSEGQYSLTGYVANADSAGQIKWIHLPYTKLACNNMVSFPDTVLSYANAQGIVFPTTYNLAIIYAGNQWYFDSGSGLSALWSAAWDIDSSIGGYIVGEMIYAGPSAMGEPQMFQTLTVHCHEYGHLFGLGDDYLGLYGYGNWGIMMSGNATGVASVMGADGILWLYGGECPPPLTAYDRYVLGWVTPTEVTSRQDVQLTYNPAYGFSNIIKVPAVNNYGQQDPDKFFLIENRQVGDSTKWGSRYMYDNIEYAEGETWDPVEYPLGWTPRRYLANTEDGLLIWRVTSDDHDLIEADGTQDRLSHGGDAFRAGHKNYLNDFSSPNARTPPDMYSVTINSQLQIENISASGFTMTANVSPGRCGTLQRNENWTHLSSDNVIIVDDLTVPEDSTLTINVNYIKVSSGKSIFVDGTMTLGGGAKLFLKTASGSYWGGLVLRSGGSIMAESTTAMYVKYTTGTGITMHENSSIISPGSINISNFGSTGLSIMGGSPSLSNISIVGLSGSNHTGIYIAGGSPDLSNISISNCSVAGITLSGSPSLDDITILGPDLGNGVSVLGGSPTLTNSSIANYTKGIVIAGAASPTIQNVTISEFDSTGIQSTSSSPTLRNLSITGASTTNYSRRGIAILGGSPAIDSISVSNCYGGGIYVDGGASITSPIHDVTTSSPIIIKGTSSVPSIHDVTGSGTISIQGGSSVSSIYDVTTSGAISVTGSSSVPVIRDISLGKSLTVNSSTVDSIRNADLYGTEAALNLISAGSPFSVGSPFVQNVTIGGTLGSVPICISGNSPTLDGDSLSISYMEDVDYGVMITGSCEPMIRRSKIQVFGEGDDVGVYIGNYSSANICDSTEIYAYTCIYGCYDAWLVMNGERGYGNGYNAIVRAPDENDNYGYAIYGFLGSVQETFDLYYNYWGTSTPNSSLFYGPTIAYTPYLTTWDHSIPKIVSSENQSLSSLARQLEFAGEWSSAAAMYEKILNDGDADTAEKRGALLSLMRIGSRGGRDFSAIQKLISAELAKKTTSGTYLKHLEQLACEVNFRLGNTDKAINGLLSVAEKYTGTALEVDMLARIAEIYGGYLEDEATAKTYADKAAAINPGAVSLYSAYKSAGIDYYPWKQDNVFATQDSTQDEPEEQAESAEEYVSISPNPANPVTTIAYSIANKGTVKLSVYAMNGQKVATLVNGPVSAGKHSVQFDGSNLASGIYFYRFESAGMKKTGKMMILK